MDPLDLPVILIGPGIIHHFQVKKDSLKANIRHAICNCYFTKLASDGEKSPAMTPAPPVTRTTRATGPPAMMTLPLQGRSIWAQ